MPMHAVHRKRPSADYNNTPDVPVDSIIPNPLPIRRNSWFLKMRTLLSATSLPSCYVILVLGTPTYQDLTPILLSGHYAHSLVIVATHQPPDIPHIVIPALRILRLTTALTGENADATRFASVLEWAERVTRDWRKYGGSGISELSEDDDYTHGSAEQRKSYPVRTASRQPPVNQGPNKSTPRVNRPFDALINFLPDRASDDVLLKQTILVTAISRPFLSTSSSGMSVYNDVFGRCRSIFSSLRSRRGESANLPRTHIESLFSSGAPTIPVATARTPHLIHLLPRRAAQYPQASMKLVESMEAFLSAFGCATMLNMDSGRNLDLAKPARPYIMFSSTFGAALDCALSRPNPDVTSRFPGDPWGCEWTVADVVLSGAMDAAPSISGGEAPDADGRTWVSGPEDIVLVSSDGRISAPLLAAARPVSVYQPLAVQSLRPIIQIAPTGGQGGAENPRPDSPDSVYSTSYGHSLIGSPPPSFREIDDHAPNEHRSRSLDIEETPILPPESKRSETKDLTDGAPLRRSLSIQRVQALVAGWKNVSAWKYGGKGKEATTA